MSPWAVGPGCRRRACSRPHPPTLTHVLIAILWLPAALAATNSTDVAALLSLKRSLGAPPELSSWVTSTDPCGSPKWFGVTSCTAAPAADAGSSHSASQRVSALELPNLGLAGTLPATLGNMTGLTKLDLSGNAIEGPLPPELGNLTSLVYLDLHLNSLRGPMPASLGGSKSLSYLDLSSNHLTGPIPASIGDLSDLSLFSISFNNISGPIPQTMGRLASLVHLHMDHNLLNGSIPSALSNLPNLIHLVLNSNRLSGPLPTELAGLASILVIWLQENGLNGKLPKSYEALTTVQEFNASTNLLSGPIPSEWGSMNGLVQLDLSHNQLQGSIPASLVQPQGVMNIDVAGNNLTGTVPSAFCSSGHLQALDLSINLLQGPLPTSCFKPAPALTTLRLHNNRFNGPFPTLPTVDLTVFNNPWCNNATNLIACQPPSISAAPSSAPSPARDAITPGGGGGGAIALAPPTGCNCGTGLLPRPYLVSQVGSQVGGDAPPCECAVPMEVGFNFPMIRLTAFDDGMRVRLLQGVASALSLDQVQVELSRQCQFGSAPDCSVCKYPPCGGTAVTVSLLPLIGSALNPLQAQAINARLTDPGADTFRFVFLGSEFLNYTVAAVTLPITPTPFPTNNSGGGGGGTATSHSSPTALVAAVAGIVAVLVLLGTVAGVLVWRYRSRLRQWGRLSDSTAQPVPWDMTPAAVVGGTKASSRTRDMERGSQFLATAHRRVLVEPVTLFTLNEIVAATSSFADDNCIGRGGFGQVYRGELEDGREVAVKRLSAASMQGQSEFRAEVQAMSFGHPHLVRLVGYCSQGKERILVYEYMSGGNLYRYLRSSSPKHVQHGVLDWDLRVQIAYGAALGLKYLHEEVYPPVIHRDLKATNILLSKDFQAKIGDFGLCRLYNTPDATHVATRVVGTLGYLDPLYGQSGTFTKSSDVYSLGVVYLELLSGRVAIDGAAPDLNPPLLPWVMKYRHSSVFVRELVDPALAGAYPPEAAAEWAQLALQMASGRLEERPTMGKVVTSLEHVQELSASLAAPRGPYAAPGSNTAAARGRPTRSSRGTVPARESSERGVPAGRSSGRGVPPLSSSDRGVPPLSGANGRPNPLSEPPGVPGTNVDCESSVGSSPFPDSGDMRSEWSREVADNLRSDGPWQVGADGGSLLRGETRAAARTGGRLNGGYAELRTDDVEAATETNLR